VKIRKGNEEMKKCGKKILITGILLVCAFALWSVLIQTIDVQNVGVNGTAVGFAALNSYVHSLTGVNMTLYNITDWLGLVPVAVCMIFGLVGFVQLIKRKSFLKVDRDIIFLGIYYVIVTGSYLIFEMIPINYRPILINGFMEASYPSSTTLLVLSVMPTLIFQNNRRIKNKSIRKVINVVSVLFAVFMVTGRLVSGVHWFTDIVGSVFLSAGLFYVYKGIVLICDEK